MRARSGGRGRRRRGRRTSTAAALAGTTALGDVGSRGGALGGDVDGGGARGARAVGGAGGTDGGREEGRRREEARKYMGGGLLSRVKPPPGTKGPFVPGGGFTRDKRPPHIFPSSFALPLTLGFSSAPGAAAPSGLLPPPREPSTAAIDVAAAQSPDLTLPPRAPTNPPETRRNTAAAVTPSPPSPARRRPAATGHPSRRTHITLLFLLAISIR